MAWFSNLPVRKKLLGLILLCSGITLVLAMAAILIYDSYDYKVQKVRDLNAQAQVLGKTASAALVFNDAATAKDYLAALQAKPSITAGAFYDEAGKLFASYSKDGAPHVFPPMQMSGYRFEDGDIVLFHAIKQNTQTIGTVYLRAPLAQLSRLIDYAKIIFLVALASLGIGVWISNRLQRFVSAPILEIATVAKAVIDTKDYSLRAKQQSADEIGELTAAFNAMLSHIEDRDEKLLAINNALKTEIEERRQAQDALKHNMRDLARSNAELEQFAYVSSHDLQEPLRMVASYTQLLEKRYKEKFDDKGLTFLHYIVDGAKRMQELIDDLLMFSRVGTRGKELQPIAIQGPLNTALLNLKPVISETGTEINWETLPEVMGDPIQLTQLFQNLISNAIKFNHGQGVKIHIKVTTENDFWLFAVKDNGIGINKEHFERIFIIFQRLHGRSEYPGSGIGLAICKKIIERHGGRIWVESEEGHGATFYFTLRKVI